MTMATNTVGLDMGRTAIKAVRLRRTLAGRETIDFLRQDISLADQKLGEDRQRQLLTEFVQKHRLAGARIMFFRIRQRCSILARHKTFTTKTRISITPFTQSVRGRDGRRRELREARS